MTTTSATIERPAAPQSRHEWAVAEVEALFELPLLELVFRAQQVHRSHFDPQEVQRSTLLSIKTGGCSKDCGYCSQSARHDSGLARQRLLPIDEVLARYRADSGV